MMASTTMVTIAKTEFTAASRLWWIRLLTVAFALLAIAMAQATSVVGDGTDSEVFARLTVALLPLALLLVPLAALLIGVSSVSGEDNSSGFLLGLPVTATEVALGQWIGQACALAASIGSGLGVGGFVVWANTNSNDVLRLMLLMAACLLLALAFLSIATLIATAVSTRGAALGIAAFVWSVAVLLYDAAALAAALWLPGRQGARLLFGSVFVNVVDLVRVLTLTLAGTPHILGAAGESWLRALGGPLPSAAAAGVSLCVWIVVPVAIAARLRASRDYR